MFEIYALFILLNFMHLCKTTKSDLTIRDLDSLYEILNSNLITSNIYKKLYIYKFTDSENFFLM